MIKNDLLQQLMINGKHLLPHVGPNQRKEQAVAMSYTVICELSSGCSSAPRLSVITLVDPPESRSEGPNAGDLSELLCESAANVSPQQYDRGL
jgi:hypothetical protein